MTAINESGGYVGLGLRVNDILQWGAPDDVVWVPDLAVALTSGQALGGLVDMANKPLLLTAANGGFYHQGPDFTGGDAANTLKVTVWYSVVDV